MGIGQGTRKSERECASLTCVLHEVEGPLLHTGNMSYLFQLPRRTTFQKLFAHPSRHGGPPPSSLPPLPLFFRNMRKTIWSGLAEHLLVGEPPTMRRACTSESAWFPFKSNLVGRTIRHRNDRQNGCSSVKCVCSGIYQYFGNSTERWMIVDLSDRTPFPPHG